MTTERTRMLPSISNLLIHQDSLPILNLSPASPVVLPATPPYNNKSPNSHLSLDNQRFSPLVSPITSPSLSPYIQTLSLNSNNSLPPLEGDDPPQRLRLPSPVSPITPKNLFNSSNTNSYQHHSPSPSCSSVSTSSTTMSLNEPGRNPTYTVEEASASPPLSHQAHKSPPVPNTQIVFDASGQPVLKRRRGRPPTCNNNFENGGWTFLTPTVWDIHVSEEQKERELKADHDLSILKAKQQYAHNPHILEDMSESLNAFTNSNMDTLLQMPRKKRGRKPKTHIAGNSCFVWKDLTSSRSPSKK